MNLSRINKDLINNPYISVIIPAINTHNWKNVINSFKSQKIKNELIFIGPKNPDFKLPSHCRFIKTFVKPPQCLEIGRRASKGNFILQYADDYLITSETNDPLYSLYLAWKKKPFHNTIVSCLYHINKKKSKAVDLRYLPSDPTILPHAPLFPKILYKIFGSYDKRFTAVLADVDLYLRFIKGGCKIIFSKVIANEDKNVNKGNFLLGDHWQIDRFLLDRFWIEDESIPLNKRKLANKRKLDLQKFTNSNLLTKTQGNQGKWKSNSNIYNYIIIHPLFNFFKNLLKQKYFLQYVASIIRQYYVFRLLLNYLKNLKKIKINNRAKIKNK
jgi:hypothetical protein